MCFLFYTKMFLCHSYKYEGGPRPHFEGPSVEVGISRSKDGHSNNIIFVECLKIGKWVKVK